MPQDFGIAPRRVSGFFDFPDGNHIIYATKLLIHRADDTGSKKVFHVGFDGFKQRIDALEITMLRRAGGRFKAKLSTSLHDRQRQVVIDVCVHSRQRELLDEKSPSQHLQQIRVIIPPHFDPRIFRHDLPVRFASQ